MNDLDFNINYNYIQYKNHFFISIKLDLIKKVIFLRLLKIQSIINVQNVKK